MWSAPRRLSSLHSHAGEVQYTLWLCWRFASGIFRSEVFLRLLMAEEVLDNSAGQLELHASSGIRGSALSDQPGAGLACMTPIEGRTPTKGPVDSAVKC
jgi:hypothetical protein